MFLALLHLRYIHQYCTSIYSYVSNTDTFRPLSKELHQKDQNKHNNHIQVSDLITICDERITSRSKKITSFFKI